MRIDEKRRTPTYIHIFLAICAAFAVVFTLFNNHLLDALQNKQNQNFNTQQFLQASLAARIIEKELEAFADETALLTRYFAPSSRTEPPDWTRLQRILETEIDRHSGAGAFMLFSSPDHYETMGVRDNAKTPMAVRQAGQWSVEHWNNPALEAGKLFIPPITATPERQFMGFMLPLMRGSVRVGTLVAVLDLEPLIRQYVGAIRTSLGGDQLMITGQGVVVHDQDKTLVGTSLLDPSPDHGAGLDDLARALLSKDSGQTELSYARNGSGAVVKRLVAWDAAKVGNQRLIASLSAPKSRVDAALDELRLAQNLTTAFIALLSLGFTFFYFRWAAARHARENDIRVQFALEGNRDGVWDWKPGANTIYFSPRLKEIHGYGPDEDIPHTPEQWRERIHPDDLESVMREFKRHLNGETGFFEQEYRTLAKEGTYIWILDRGKVVERDKSGRPLRVIGTHTDVTKAKMGEMEIRKLSLAVEQSPTSIVITDPDGVILYVNESFADAFGYGREEAVGRSMSIVKSGVQPPAVYKKLWDTIASGRQWRGEMVNASKDGRRIWMRVSISPVLDESGKITGFVGIQEDISELKEKENELARLATTDELTGIFNRRKFMESARFEFKRAKRLAQPIAVAIFDIDLFKNVNDAHGHDFGDKVLQGVAGIAGANIREIDILGRIGGEEFGLILPHTEPAQAALIAERVRKAIESQCCTVGGRSIGTTVSFGLSNAGPEYPDDVEELIKQADRALYAAKNNGRNRVEIFGPDTPWMDAAKQG